MSEDEDARRRRRLVEGISGTVAAIALSLAAEVGDRWLEDLEAYGHLGAVEAARAYDFSSKTSFEGFAWARIVGAMIDFLRRERVKLSPSTVAALEKAAAAIEVAAEYAIAVRDKGGDDADEEADGAAAVVGMGLLCMGSGTGNPETQLLREERRAHVRRAISFLPERDRVMVTLRYFEGQRFKQIAEHFGIDPDYARERHRSALRRLGAILRPILVGA